MDIAVRSFASLCVRTGGFVILDLLYDVRDIDGQCYEYNNFSQLRRLKTASGFIINIFIRCNDFKLQ